MTLLFLSAGCASSIPLRSVDRLPAVNVSVGGVTATFIIDVDANVIAIAPSLASRLGLPATGQTVTIPSLAVGDHRLRGVVAVVDPFLDEVGHDGVLGTPAYDDLLLTVDHPAQVVRLERGSLAPGRNVFTCSDELPQRCAIPITLAGTPRIAILDTAAQRAMLIPAEIAATLPLTGRRTGGVAVGPQTGRTAVQDATLAGDVMIGSHRVSTPDVTIHDRPRILLGSALLSRFVVTFDLKNRRVRISAP